jgi:CBS domain containing-hemolysin-like protein
MDTLDSSTIGLIISLAALLLFSAFFSACEMAFSSLNRIKLKNLAAQNNKKAQLALKLLNAYDKLLSTVLIGNNVVNIGSSALATLLFVGIFGPKGVSLATLVMTVLVLLVGEISPKTLAKESPERTAMNFAPLLHFFMILFTPANYLAALWKKFIVTLFPAKGDRSVTEDELLTFVGEVREEGGINSREEEMIRQVIEFDDITAGEIYTPRIDVSAVSAADSPAAIDRAFYETGYSRLPVYEDTIDNITGVILLKDFHHAVIRQGADAVFCAGFSLETIQKPVVFITKSMKISELLRTLQEKQSHISVLVDEFGGTLGIITIEDIVEELVGEIWDEHDEVVEDIKTLADGTVLVLGKVSLTELFEHFSLDAEENAISNTTVGSWVMETLGNIPRTGDHFTYKNLEIRVSKKNRNRVMEVAVTVKTEEEEE